MDERGEHLDTVAMWQDAVRSSNELANGYRYELEGSDGLIEALGRFIENERRCCPFFDFELQVPAAGVLALTITGPEGAKAILEGAAGRTGH